MAFDDKRKEIKVNLNEDDNETFIIIEGFSSKIQLTTDNTNDLEKFYNELFDKILQDKLLYKFVYNSEERSDLLSDVTTELIEQLNSEITSSLTAFTEIESFLES